MGDNCDEHGAPLDGADQHNYDINLSEFMQDKEDFEALGKIAHAFREYKTDAEWDIKRWEYNYSRQDKKNYILNTNRIFQLPAAR